MTTPYIKVLPNLQAIAADAAERIVATSAEKLDSAGEFSIALSGGSTPKTLFELLATDDFRDRVNWTKMQIFFGDERAVPPDHPDSNYRMAREALLSKVPIPGDNIHRMRGEIDPNEAAIEYGKMLKEHFGDGGLDLILLGMGDDGHTASLFPHSEALKETKHRCAANYVDKMKTWRITMTAPFINRAAQVLVMVAGKSKVDRVAQVLHGPRDPANLPIQLISPESGNYVWLLDVGAAGMEEE